MTEKFTSRWVKRPNEERATSVYLIKRESNPSFVKIGVTKGVRARLSHLAHACPEQLSIVRTIKPGRGLAFHIESAFKYLMRPFRVRGEWFKCDAMLAIIALHVAEHGDLKGHTLIKSEIERPWADRGLIIDKDARLAHYRAWHDYYQSLRQQSPRLARYEVPLSRLKTEARDALAEAANDAEDRLERLERYARRRKQREAREAARAEAK